MENAKRKRGRPPKRKAIGRASKSLHDNIGVPQKKTKSYIRVKCFIHRLTNRSQRLQSLSVVQLPELSPMPSKTAHKSLIGLLSVGFRGNKKGLDSSVFIFRENH